MTMTSRTWSVARSLCFHECFDQSLTCILLFSFCLFVRSLDGWSNNGCRGSGHSSRVPRIQETQGDFHRQCSHTCKSGRGRKASARERECELNVHILFRRLCRCRRSLLTPRPRPLPLCPSTPSESRHKKERARRKLLRPRPSALASTMWRKVSLQSSDVRLAQCQ